MINLFFSVGGREVARRQIVRSRDYKALYTSLPACESSCNFSNGILSSLQYFGREMLDGGVRFNLCRAYIDNDVNLKPHWQTLRLQDAYFFAKRTKIKGKSVTAYGTIGVDGLKPIADAELSFEKRSGGSIHVACEVKIGEYVKNLPRFGLQFRLASDLKNVTYFGRGEGEAYADRVLSCPFGLYRSDADHFNFTYAKPQESGARCGTRCVAVYGEKYGFAVDSKDDFSFNFTRYDVKDYRLHAHEMPSSDAVFLNVDYKMSGLGSNSCGPMLDEKYLLTERRFKFSFDIKPFSTDNDVMKIHFTECK